MTSFEWINNDLLTGLLSEQHGTSFKRLLGYDVNFATKKGDNYASEMYRVSVRYDIGTVVEKSIILKVMPSGELQQQVMQENSIYAREMVIYNRIMPKIYQLLSSIGDCSIISPLCLSTANTPKQLLVFEDVNEQGFKMVDRRFGLDYDHARLVVVKLAKLHACSRIVHEADPTLFELTMEGCISEDPKKQTFLPYYRRCVGQVVRLVQQWNKEGRWDSILRKLEKLQDKIIPYGCAVYRRREDCFNVLNHNDIWVNNMMFRYGEGVGVKDVLLLDYQLSYYGSPGVDLNFFLYGSLQPKLYHTTLRWTLEELDYGGTIPTLPDIHVEIIRKGFHRVNAVFQQLPVAMMERSEDADMDLILGEGERSEACRRELFDNPRYVSILPALLQEFDLDGYLD
uniref:CHK domain-containing protein n=1 Tax=Anopheles christyi TaxID=43041 RepID=A0A182JZL1_9DIPT